MEVSVMTTILCDSCHRIHRKGNYWEVVVLSRVLGDGTFVLYHFHIILCGFPPGAHKLRVPFFWRIVKRSRGCLKKIIQRNLVTWLDHINIFHGFHGFWASLISTFFARCQGYEGLPLCCLRWPQVVWGAPVRPGDLNIQFGYTDTSDTLCPQCPSWVCTCRG